MASSAPWISRRDRAGFVRTAELGDVCTGGEDALPTGDHDGARRVGGQLVRRLVQLGDERPGEGVDLAVGQRDDGNPVVAAIEGQQLGHRASLARSVRRNRITTIDPGGQVVPFSLWRCSPRPRGA